jgi:hypothetical protein
MYEIKWSMMKGMNTEALNENPVPMLLCLLHISDGLSCEIHQLVISKLQRHNEW